MKIGYARVSTIDQNLDLQIDALKKAECGRIFQEKITGTKTERPQLQEAIDYARPKDILVVWKLDRLGRSLSNLLEIMATLRTQRIAFRSLTE